MSDLSPLERLDDAIRAYILETDDEGQLSGWVLATQTVIITNEDGVLPLAFASDFTMGPSTSPETAIGLSQVTRARLEAQLVYDADEDD